MRRPPFSGPGRRPAYGPVQQPVPLRRVGLGVGIGPVRSGPRQQVAEAVLDGRRAVGQLVHRLGDSGLPLPAERHLGQPVVNLHAAHQREVGHAQLPGLFPLPAVQARVRQGHPRLLGQHLQQEPLALRGRGRGPDDQVAGRPVAAGQRVGPRPRHVGQRDQPALGRVDGGLQAGGLPAGDPDVLPPAVEEDALRRARPQGSRPRSRRSAGCCPGCPAGTAGIASTSMLRSAESCSRTGPS